MKLSDFATVFGFYCYKKYNGKIEPPEYYLEFYDTARSPHTVMLCNDMRDIRVAASVFYAAEHGLNTRDVWKQIERDFPERLEDDITESCLAAAVLSMMDCGACTVKLGDYGDNMALVCHTGDLQIPFRTVWQNPNSMEKALADIQKSDDMPEDNPYGKVEEARDIALRVQTMAAGVTDRTGSHTDQEAALDFLLRCRETLPEEYKETLIPGSMPSV